MLHGMSDRAADDSLVLGPDDDGQLFLIRVLNSGEERVARYHHSYLAGRELLFPCFADPNNPGNHLKWSHAGWGAVAVRRV